MKRGKSQYALEFLVTYGWALLILGVIVGAIYSFGWVDPANFLPQKCNFYGQVGCRDFYLSEDSFNLSVVNNFGVKLYIDGLTLIVNGNEACNSNGSFIEWERSGLSVVGLDLTDPGCNSSLITKGIIPGTRADVVAKLKYFSNETCPSCWSSGPDCRKCLHSASGRVLVKVSK